MASYSQKDRNCLTTDINNLFIGEDNDKSRKEFMSALCKKGESCPVEYSYIGKPKSDQVYWSIVYLWDLFDHRLYDALKTVIRAANSLSDPTMKSAVLNLIESSSCSHLFTGIVTKKKEQKTSSTINFNRNDNIIINKTQSKITIQHSQPQSSSLLALSMHSQYSNQEDNIIITKAPSNPPRQPLISQDYYDSIPAYNPLRNSPVTFQDFHQLFMDLNEMLLGYPTSLKEAQSCITHSKSGGGCGISRSSLSRPSHIIYDALKILYEEKRLFEFLKFVIPCITDAAFKRIIKNKLGNSKVCNFFAVGVKVTYPFENNTSSTTTSVPTTTTQNNDDCVICLDKSKAIMFTPCKHRITCETCAPSVSICPTCRANIVGRVRVYG